METVILTGCSRGIGKAILNELIKLPNLKIIAISLEISDFQYFTQQNIFKYHCDFSNVGETIRVLEEVVLKYKHIDILINNAGVGIFKKVEDLTIEDWNKVVSINLTTPFLFIKTFLPAMKEINKGKIINITSDADHNSFPEGSLYCATKFALKGLTDSIRKELVGTNISMTNIGPARVDTFFNNKKPGDRPNALQPKDVADQVIHILKQSKSCGIESIYLTSTMDQ